MKIINFSNNAKLVNDDIKEINKENNKDMDIDIDCKSQPEKNCLSFGKNNLTDDDTSAKNTKSIRRVMSLVDGEYIAKKIKDAITGDLKNIKNNFSNKFKDIDNVSDND